jgi:hypothetical protein
MYTLQWFCDIVSPHRSALDITAAAAAAAVRAPAGCAPLRQLLSAVLSRCSQLSRRYLGKVSQPHTKHESSFEGVQVYTMTKIT